MKQINFSAPFTVLLAILAGVVLLLLSCSYPVGLTTGYKYDSNGQRIYFTAESASGDLITYSGGIRMMHTISCADCHGPDGRGGRVSMMMRQYDVPDITWDNLSEEEHHEEAPGEEEHEEHPPYTEATLKRAITMGVNPAGEPLDELMPRWRMSDRDLDDLVEFMMSLE